MYIAGLANMYSSTVLFSIVTILRQNFPPQSSRFSSVLQLTSHDVVEYINTYLFIDHIYLHFNGGSGNSRSSLDSVGKYSPLKPVDVIIDSHISPL